MTKFSELPTQIQKYYQTAKPTLYPSQYINRITWYINKEPEQITVTLVRDVKDRWFFVSGRGWIRKGR